MTQSLAELARLMGTEVDLTDRAELERAFPSPFTPFGEFLVGIRVRPAHLGDHDNEYLGPRGITVPDRQPFGIGSVFGGTPHHAKHMFGYWHINDCDEIAITIPGPTPDADVTRIIMMRYPTGDDTDRYAWYCQQCLTLLYCFTFPTGEHGFFPGFFEAENEAVGTFNADRKLRICPECGWEHPLGYRFNPAANSPEEEEVRAAW